MVHIYPQTFELIQNLIPLGVLAIAIQLLVNMLSSGSGSCMQTFATHGYVPFCPGLQAMKVRPCTLWYIYIHAFLPVESGSRGLTHATHDQHLRGYYTD